MSMLIQFDWSGPAPRTVELTLMTTMSPLGSEALEPYFYQEYTLTSITDYSTMSSMLLSGLLWVLRSCSLEPRLSLGSRLAFMAIAVLLSGSRTTQVEMSVCTSVYNVLRRSSRCWADVIKSPTRSLPWRSMQLLIALQGLDPRV
jgi:hypothetical protein